MKAIRKVVLSNRATPGRMGCTTYGWAHRSLQPAAATTRSEDACRSLALLCSARRHSGRPFTARLEVAGHRGLSRAVWTFPRNGSERVRGVEVRGLPAWKQ